MIKVHKIWNLSRITNILVSLSLYLEPWSWPWLQFLNRFHFLSWLTGQDHGHWHPWIWCDEGHTQRGRWWSLATTLSQLTIALTFPSKGEEYFKFRLRNCGKNPGGKWANKGSVCFPQLEEAFKFARDFPGSRHPKVLLLCRCHNSSGGHFLMR